MQKQRERMEARRKRLKEAAKKAAESKTKKTAPAKVKGIGPVKDGATYARKLKNSKTKPTGVGPVKSGSAYARSLTKGKSTPATKADPKPSLKNKPVNKVPSTTKSNPNKPQSKENKSQLNNLRMKDHPGLAINKPTPKNPAFKMIDGVLHRKQGNKYVPSPQLGASRTKNGKPEYWDGRKWVPGRSKSTRFKG